MNSYDWRQVIHGNTSSKPSRVAEILKSFRHRVVYLLTPVPVIATTQTRNRQPAAGQCAEPADRLFRISGASWREVAFDEISPSTTLSLVEFNKVD